MGDGAAHEGAGKIIRHCLGLGRGQGLVVFLDETTVPVASLLIMAAAAQDVAVTPIFIPSALQRRKPVQQIFTVPVSAALRDARAIITCVNADPDSLPFRDHILENERGARTRIGHMPGASMDVLAMANVDIPRLVADCARLEQTMIRGSRVELISHTADGAEHRLQAAIGGWERLPVASDGVIREGSWGNVPSGETYIAPVEGTAEGSVVIDGSLPGLVIAPGEEIVLHFAAGRLVAIEPDDRPAARWLRATQIDRAEAAGDGNWRNLAEIGIGVNPAVTRLTGTMLFDEKSAGTVHIALGSNTFMGGRVASAIHCDMVIRRPTVRIDGRPVVARGLITVVEEQWLEPFAAVALADSPLREAAAVARTGVDADLAEGLLRRVVRSETGRVSLCQVGDAETAQLAARLYAALPVNSYPAPLGRLIAQSHLAPDAARQVLHIMHSYGLIQITRA